MHVTVGTACVYVWELLVCMCGSCLCVCVCKSIWPAAQDRPDVEYAGWKKLSSTPELNFLSQIVILLFEKESQPKNSSARYYINLHIGSGVKARKQTFGEGVPFIDGETHLPSFVKRLPTLPAGHRGSEAATAPIAMSSPSRGVRKIASYPFLHPKETPPITVVGTPPYPRSSSSMTSALVDITPAKLSPDSPGKKLTIGYTDESLQTLGVPGQFIIQIVAHSMQLLNYS